jgi:hypothetical protein
VGKGTGEAGASGPLAYLHLNEFRCGHLQDVREHLAAYALVDDAVVRRVAAAERLE